MFIDLKILVHSSNEVLCRCLKETEALMQGYEKSSKILTISDVLKNQKLKNGVCNMLSFVYKYL